MSTPLGEAREWAEGLLRGLAPLGVQTYPAPPENPTVPCYVVSAGNPWVIRGKTFAQTGVNLRLSVMVAPTAGNAPAQDRLEELLWPLLAVFTPSGPIEPPRLERLGQAEFYQIDVPISTLVGDTT